MQTLLEQMQRKQTIDATFHWMEEHDMQTDDLLKKFEKLGVNPVPLRKGHHASCMPSLLEILRTVDEQAISIYPICWKKQSVSMQPLGNMDTTPLS